MASLVQAGLYAVTDPELLPGERLFSGVEAAVRGGAVLVQYRDKPASPQQRRDRARRLLGICQDYGCPLVINDNLELALEVDADGVHLGQEDGSLAKARALLSPGKILGATCHSSMGLAKNASAAGCDYLAFGRFFNSQTKQQAPAAPLSILGSARAFALPTAAIGGLTLDNAGPVIAAGADLLAVIHGLFSASDIETRARQFSQLIYDVRTARDAPTQEPAP